MMTKTELHDELWMLAKGLLQDSRIDSMEAKVIKRWLEEHQSGAEFQPMIDKLNKFLADGFIDQIESRRLIDSLGSTLRELNAH